MSQASAIGDHVVNEDVGVRMANAKKLAAGYTRRKRLMECCYLSTAIVLWLSNFVIVGRYFAHGKDVEFSQLMWTPLMVLLAMLLADFISGVVHWGLDTWGTPETFIFGNFIRSFREHHANQVAMTHHDFIETNADTTLPLIPLLLLQRYFLTLTPRGDASDNMWGHGRAYNVDNSNACAHVFTLTLMLFVGFTNELHKWAHDPRPHALARFLMSTGVVLTPAIHLKHHTGNIDSSYCITVGWLNAPLDAINFWRRAEAVVTSLTGSVPRANDKELLGRLEVPQSK
ncbi:B domain [Trypanosoma vivax]|uniref:Putative ubiquitin-conjugating enzyme variant Kua homologue n=1 Tax=Trypanosoma vivax (strain Y486) TaxID=1055687 RepID=G0U5M3_TRYVY|nr:putative ubiquitin-conjugating enzyme variant Kua like protein [Trypanosoma vivax]KAH8614487.1 B domain [Trypanosoma vivax]CCC51174.1 putative ubiquitin-conjugating enzyme variant Kua homologue [Trypanosoma vivax Y486]